MEAGKMNSSINPPKQTRKFQFETDFHVEEARARQEALEAEALRQSPVEVAPPPPVFSEQDLSLSREDAFKKGFEQGQAEAQNSIEKSLGTLLTIVISHLDALQAQEDKRLQQMYDITLRTTVAAIKKIWPTVIQSQSMAMVENTVRQSLEYNSEEQRIVIRVHDTMLDPLIRSLPQLQEQQAFAGKIIVLSDQNIGPSDCKVEWADGGMERLSRHLSAQLDQALERILASLPSNFQNANTERTSP
jgi:flagellar assembly protein FliH